MFHYYFLGSSKLDEEKPVEIVTAKKGSLLDYNWQRFQSFLLRMGTEDFPQPQENRTKRPP